MKLYDLKVKKANGTDVSLKDYQGKVLLIVNTATGCGFTPQYEGLEQLYEKYHDKDFEILDFPCNQFFEQAPGTNEELVNFCKMRFGTEFETFGKIEVNGENADPLFAFLKQQAPIDIDNGQLEAFKNKVKERFSVAESEIQWNFTKFLIDRSGEVAGRYAPTYTPEELKEAIEKLL